MAEGTETRGFTAAHVGDASRAGGIASCGGRIPRQRHRFMRGTHSAPEAAHAYTPFFASHRETYLRMTGKGMGPRSRSSV